MKMDKTKREENKFVQEPLVSVDGSDSEGVPIADVVVLAEGVAVVAVEVLGIIADVTAVAATVDAMEEAIDVKVAPVVRIRVVPEELGPARTANDTGWPLCNAAETCERSAFC